MTTIGIDVRMLARGRKTGIEEYTTELLKHLLPLDSRLRFKLFYSGWKKDPLTFDWLSRPNVELVDIKVPNRLLDHSFCLLGQPKVDRMMGGVDKFFSPHIFLSSTSKRVEKIVTFHDLSFEHYPQFYSRTKNLWHLSMAPRRQARRADKIIAVSASTKEDLCELYGISPEKIRVIHEGLASGALAGVSPAEESYVRGQFDLPRDYILYLGTLEPRKNLLSLLAAFEKLKTRGPLKDSECKLVIAGERGWLYKDIFRAAARSSSRADIIFTGFVPERCKPALYKMARVFVYPSFYEGFGFPPLEAMAQGTPVITSAVSSIPEITGGAALLINPADPDALSAALEATLTDASFRQRLSAAGRTRARSFDWGKCARETLDYILN